MDDAGRDVTVFPMSRQRLREGETARAIFGQVLEQARVESPLTSERITVVGRISEARASHTTRTALQDIAAFRPAASPLPLKNAGIHSRGAELAGTLFVGRLPGGRSTAMDLNRSNQRVQPTARIR
jgi:hypothetical protein